MLRHGTNMFKKFGIGAESSSCQHPVDENRNLWLISDFCHLVKCARNCLCPIIPTKANKKQAMADIMFEEDEDNVDEPSVPNTTTGRGRSRGRGGGGRRGVTGGQVAKNLSESAKAAVEAAAERDLKERQHAARNKEVKVPEGMVKRPETRIQELMEGLDKQHGIASLTFVPNISKKHVFPTGFERMNVKLAMQFFSDSLRAGMEFYRTNRADIDLEDS
ncbi:Glycerophosphodiester phosphodiesterase [Frankliniella fusca]|uniref:Glycerophosphodiester phosphodiesterase n=1 Tax=Frankliniella fusca TaxID=407009 RepID=A0AAE1HCW2_9NEOP|nr:Glycerophosphodiester phosphodiesterase [Frankliniella fusca]